MRAIYTLAWMLALPFAFLYLSWRARRQPEYRQHWAERLGRIQLPDSRPLIWVHAVSVGETRAAAPLINALLDRHPDYALLLTHATPTGRAAGAELYDNRVFQAYLPYDLPGLVKLFLDRARPSLGIFMETEIWPNLFSACRNRGVPLFLVNARLSEKSARGYRHAGSLTRQTLACLNGIAAQTEADAHRLQALGGQQVQVTGNLKFDVAAPAETENRSAALRALFPGRFVLLAASTREGEEARLLEAFGGCAIPNLLLVIVPRHPQRFGEVASLVERQGLGLVRRSEGVQVPDAIRIFLGDSMGEMASYYAACDLAFVGGSLLPHGGQNLIEAAAAGRPILIGPHTWNFREAAQQAVAAGAALRIHSAEELAIQVQRLHEDAAARARMGAAGLRFAEQHRGATQRVLTLLENQWHPARPG
jgi:3-deoxy-D-manno-octulosonic-acid transferase